MRVFLTILLFAWCASAFADTAPLDFQGGSAPATFCKANGGSVVDLAFGFPTTFRCRYDSGALSGYVTVNPVCPTGFIADFGKLLCVTDEVTVSLSWATSIRGLFVCFTLVFISFMGYRQGRAGG